jgi:ubiquinone/menaquinone biosynthesis C-methylase UbiE
MLEQRRNSDVISELLVLEGKRVVDVGCGSGGLARLMTRKGAQVTGIECSPRQLAKAGEIDTVGDERYLEGRGEALPLDDQSTDIVVFFNSLHHVAVDCQEQALHEAARVLVPQGLLYICEPLAEGPHFEMMKPFDDETIVRAEAIKAIGRVTGTLFDRVREQSYFYQVKDADFETFAEEMTRIDSSRDALLRENRQQLEDSFYAHGTKLEDGRYGFDQPMHINLLQKKPTP